MNYKNTTVAGGEFAKGIGMLPLPLYKEQPSYRLNSLLVPCLEAAQLFLLNEVADIEDTRQDLDDCDRRAGRSLRDSRRDRHHEYAQRDAEKSSEFEKLANLLKAEYLDKGKLGRAMGQGLYTYPNPRFASPNVLQNG